MQAAERIDYGPVLKGPRVLNRGKLLIDKINIPFSHFKGSILYFCINYRLRGATSGRHSMPADGKRTASQFIRLTYYNDKLK